MKREVKEDFFIRGDEAKAYYSLYGNLYFSVPHYVKEVILDYENQFTYVTYPSGVKSGIGVIIKSMEEI